jgi:hypothetical protein
VWRGIYFSHRRTTFTAWLLVDSHSLHPHTHPYHHHSSDWGFMFDVAFQRAAFMRGLGLM